MARPTRAAECHPDRPHKARGLCAPCYATAWETNQVPAYRNGQKAKCHPDRRHKARGLCSNCYATARKRGDFGRRDPDWQPPTFGVANCHPDRPHGAKGLCRPCYDRIRNRMTNYGLTIEAMEVLEERANGRCMICRRPDDHLVVDHCHDTGLVRGLLCGPCNTGLGVLEKRGPEWLAAAQAYVGPPGPDFNREDSRMDRAATPAPPQARPQRTAPIRVNG